MTATDDVDKRKEGESRRNDDPVDAKGALSNAPGGTGATQPANRGGERYDVNYLRALVVRILPAWNTKSADIEVTFVIPLSHIQNVDRSSSVVISIPWGEDVTGETLVSQEGAWVVSSRTLTTAAPYIGRPCDNTTQLQHDCLRLPAILKQAREDHKGYIPPISIAQRTGADSGTTFRIESTVTLPMANKDEIDKYVVVRYCVHRLPTKLYKVPKGFFNNSVNLFHWADADPMICDYLIMEVAYPLWKPGGWFIKLLARIVGGFSTEDHRHDPYVEYGTVDRPDRQPVLATRDAESFRLALPCVGEKQKLILSLTYLQEFMTAESIFHTMLAVLYVWVLGHYALDFIWSIATALGKEFGHPLPEAAATQHAEWSPIARILWVLIPKGGILFVGFAVLLLSMRRARTRDFALAKAEAPTSPNVPPPEPRTRQ